MILDNIHKLCKEKGVSIARLERETGIGNGTIARWDVCSPRLSNIKSVADYFGVTIDSLVSEEKQSG